MAEVVTCSQNMAPSLQGCSTQVGVFFPKVKLISSSFICFKMIWQRSSFILWHLSVLKYILLSNKPTDDVYFHVKLSLPQAKYVASSGWKTWMMIVESQQLAKIPLLTNVTQNKNNLVWSLLGKILEKWNEDKTNKKRSSLTQQRTSSCLVRSGHLWQFLISVTMEGWQCWQRIN